MWKTFLINKLRIVVYVSLEISREYFCVKYQRVLLREVKWLIPSLNLDSFFYQIVTQGNNYCVIAD